MTKGLNANMRTTVVAVACASVAAGITILALTRFAKTDVTARGDAPRSSVLMNTKPSATQNVPIARRNVNLPTPQGIQRGFHEIATIVRPSVVSVSTHHVVANPLDAAGMQMLQPYSTKSKLVGSGVIVHPSGYIVTSSQVTGGADNVRVIVHGGANNAIAARKIASDSATGLELIQIPFMSNLPYAQLGDSSQVKTGNVVVAMGSPFGLSETMTHGIVSASHRTINVNGRQLNDVIQTDAAINKGNCGGPLVDIYANVIGVNTAIYSTDASFAGIGFAIGSNQVKQFLNRALGMKN